MEKYYKIQIDDQIFRVSKQTLLKYTNSKFAEIIKNNTNDHKIILDRLSSTFFIDSDPESFKVVLEVMRGYTNNLNHITDQYLLRKINKDLQYFNITLDNLETQIFQNFVPFHDQKNVTLIDNENKIDHYEEYKKIININPQISETIIHNDLNQENTEFFTPQKVANFESIFTKISESNQTGGDIDQEMNGKVMYSDFINLVGQFDKNNSYSISEYMSGNTTDMNNEYMYDDTYRNMINLGISQTQTIQDTIQDTTQNNVQNSIQNSIQNTEQQKDNLQDINHMFKTINKIINIDDLLSDISQNQNNVESMNINLSNSENKNIYNIDTFNDTNGSINHNQVEYNFVNDSDEDSSDNDSYSDDFSDGDVDYDNYINILSGGEKENRANDDECSYHSNYDPFNPNIELSDNHCIYEIPHIPHTPHTPHTPHISGSNLIKILSDSNENVISNAEEIANRKKQNIPPTLIDI